MDQATSNDRPDSSPRAVPRAVLTQEADPSCTDMQFDESIKFFAAAAGRRDALRALGAAGMAILAALSLTDAAAQNKHKKKNGKGGHNKNKSRSNNRNRHSAGQSQGPDENPAEEAPADGNEGEDPGDGAAEGVNQVQAQKKKKGKGKKGPPGPTGPTGPVGPTGSGSGSPGPTGPTGPGGPETTVFADDVFRITDQANPSKRLAFQVESVGANETRTLSVPDANTTIVGTEVAQTLTRKTLAAATNSDHAVIARGAPGQSAPLLVLQNSAGAELLRLDARGTDNTWVGREAGVANTGAQNTAVGAEALRANTTGVANTAVGIQALRNNTTGFRNTALGRFALVANTDATLNTAIGSEALFSTTTGSGNTAVGAEALPSNTTGFNNTAVGVRALFDNTTGGNNSAVGVNSLDNNTTGGNNTAVGRFALFANTDASNNAAVGFEALRNNTTGTNNAALGAGALRNNTTSHNNTAVGTSALSANTAANNTAIGFQALRQNTTGFNNTAVGVDALQDNTNGPFNTAVGAGALFLNTSGGSNTALGFEALRNNTTGSSNTALGHQALFLNFNNYSNTTGLGANSEVTGDNQVQLGDAATTTFAFGAVQNRSDLRDKSDVRDTVLGLDFITALRPVDFRWDLRDDYRPDPPEAPGPEVNATELEAYQGRLAQWAETSKLGNLTHDGSKRRTRFHHGLIAQEVAEVIARTGVDFGGYQDHAVKGGDDVLSLGYEEFIAPLIKAVQELAARNEDLEAENGRILERLAALEAARAG